MVVARDVFHLVQPEQEAMKAAKIADLLLGAFVCIIASVIFATDFSWHGILAAIMFVAAFSGFCVAAAGLIVGDE